MKHYQSCIAASFVFLSFLVSCPFSVNAVDIGIDDQSGIYEYLDAGQQGLINIDFELNEDQDGNRSKRLQIYALQKLAFQEQSGIYENMDFSVAPDTVAVSGSGRSGLYIDDSGLYQPCTLYTISGSLLQPKTLCSAPDFTVVLQSDSDINYTFLINSGFQGISYWMTYGYSGRTYRVTTGARPGTYSEPNYGGSYINGLGVFINDTNQIPRLSDMNFSNHSVTVCGTAQSVSLPSGNVDTEKPWDYYNNTLLPYIQEEFPGFEQYFVFPDGYVPPAQPTTVPIEYPTLPGFDWTFAENGTLPAGAESVNYDIPDLDTKTVAVPQFDWNSINPAEVIAPVSNGLTAIWALISDILSSFGLFPLVSLSLLVGIITALLLLGR